MILLKIAFLIQLFVILILIVAYIEVHQTMQWYKIQFNHQPRKQYRLIPKNSWQQRVVNLFLMRRPVSIKRQFKYFKVDEENGDCYIHTDHPLAGDKDYIIDIAGKNHSRIQSDLRPRSPWKRH